MSISSGFEPIITQTVREGRELAESLMTATCVIRRATGDMTVDPATDADVPEYADLFTSVCKVQARNLQARQQEAGGRTATTVALQLHLPVSAAEVSVGDYAHVLTSPLDPELVGRTFTVVGPSAKSYATARRLEIEEVVA